MLRRWRVCFSTTASDRASGCIPISFAIRTRPTWFVPTCVKVNRWIGNSFRSGWATPVSLPPWKPMCIWSARTTSSPTIPLSPEGVLPMPLLKRKRRIEPRWTIVQRKLLAVLEQQENRILGPGDICQLAGYGDWAWDRATKDPRFGSPQERLFGTMETEFLYHLLGNTQATREPRQNTRATDPRRQAVWTLPALAERVQQWADEEYETIRHPALGMTPREAYELSLKRDGERLDKAIEYDDEFLRATFPTTKKGTAKVEPGVGVRMNYLDYW